MSGWIITESNNGSADVHNHSGVFTYGSKLCPGVPPECQPYLTYNVKAIIDEDTSNFDGFHNLIGDDNDIEVSVTAKGCNCEGFIMWFNYGSNMVYDSVLDNNSIFDIKNVDDCDIIVLGTPLTGSQNFDTGSSTQGHKIKYRITDEMIPDNFYTDHQELVELYFPHLYSSGDVGKNTNEIGVNAFKGCSRLSAITLSAVEYIDDGAFSGCNALSTIDWGHSACNLSSKVKVIGDNAFRDCYALTRILIPDTVKSIGNHAFGGCINTSTLHIGKNVDSIGDYAFAGIYNYGQAELTIDIPESVQTFGNNAFSSENAPRIRFVLHRPPIGFTSWTFGAYVFSSESNNCLEIRVPSQYYNDYVNFFQSNNNLINYVDKLVAGV